MIISITIVYWINQTIIIHAFIKKTIKEKVKKVNILFCLKPNEKFKQNNFCIISKNVKLAFIGDIYEGKKETFIIFIQ